MFYKKVNKSSFKDMFEFLTKHFEYDTMNSWNGQRSIANKVKLYCLDLRNDWTDVHKALEDDDWCIVNMMLKEFEETHRGCSLGFNGRSGGYLVLYPEHGVRHIFDSDFYSPCQYDDYDNWKEDVRETYGSLKAYLPDLLREVELVQAFDKLCDELVEAIDELTDSYLEAVKEEEFRQANMHKFVCTKHFEEYYYDNIDDYNLHKKYMTEKGYSIYEENEDDLYIMFEMHECVKGEVFVDPRKEN